MRACVCVRINTCFTLMILNTMRQTFSRAGSPEHGSFRFNSMGLNLSLCVRVGTLMTPACCLFPSPSCLVSLGLSRIDWWALPTPHQWVQCVGTGNDNAVGQRLDPERTH